MAETLKFMLEQLIPEDNDQDDTITQERRETNRTTDRNHWRQRFHPGRSQIIEGLIPRKAPGPEGITSEILILFSKAYPKL